MATKNAPKAQASSDQSFTRRILESTVSDVVAAAVIAVFVASVRFLVNSDSTTLATWAILAGSAVVLILFVLAVVLAPIWWTRSAFKDGAWLPSQRIFLSIVTVALGVAVVLTVLWILEQS